MKVHFLSIVLLFAECLHAESLWFASDSQLLEVAQRSAAFQKKSGGAQENELKELKEGLLFATSVAAYQAFLRYVDQSWSNSFIKEHKNQIIFEAKKAAKAAALQKVESLMTQKINGRLLSAKQMALRSVPSNPVDEKFWEMDQFLDSKGNFDFRVLSFNRSTELSKRGELDLLSWADKSYSGSPEIRRKKRAEASSFHSLIKPEFPPARPLGHEVKCGPSTCGLPSNSVGALRPESNGLR